MKGVKSYTREQEEYIIQNYLKMTAKELSEKTGLSKYVVSSLVNRKGLKKRNFIKNINKEKIKTIIPIYSRKVTVLEFKKIVEDELNILITRDNCYRICKELGFESFVGKYDNRKVRRYFKDGNKNNLKSENIVLVKTNTYHNLRRMNVDENNFNVALNISNLTQEISKHKIIYTATHIKTGEVKQANGAKKISKIIGFESNAYYKRKTKGPNKGVMIGNWEVIKSIKNANKC